MPGVPRRACLVAVLVALGGCTEFHVAAGGPGCANGEKDGDETDVDCGGSCGGCAPGRRCGVPGDCESGLCDGGRCVAPSCADHEKNGGETDVDCGGPCSACADGKRCLAAADCASGSCAPSGVCSPSSCSDGEVDGDESDVDCGGRCKPCDLGLGCSRDADCAAGHCMTSRCEDVVGIWKKATPSSSPSPRMAFGMIHDPTQGVLLVGGLDGNGARADTWAYDGATWHDLGVSPGGARDFTTLVYDATSANPILSGGGANKDTWKFSSGTWSFLSGSGAPTARVGVAAAYVAGVVATFGGVDGSGFYADTNVFSTGSVTWSATGATGPGARYGGAMESDPLGTGAILFGGTPNNVHAFDETWRWDGVGWTQLAPAARPVGRWAPALAYDTIRSRWVLFGGQRELAVVDLTDTWEFDGLTWIRTATTGPPARGWSRAAFSGGKVVLFGGSKAPGAFLGDTWEYHAVGNACSHDEECDTGSCIDGLCCEAACGTCEACNLAASPGRCAKVTNRPDPDSCDGTCDANGACR